MGAYKLSIDVILLSIDVAPFVAAGVDFQPNWRDSGYGRRDNLRQNAWSNGRDIGVVGGNE
jgi:hypothetical protein